MPKMSIVYVIGRNGNPLMPCKPARARHLLEAGEARVKTLEPFTIQMTVATTEEVQPVTVGLNLGAKKVGAAAVGNGKTLYQAEVALRTDIHKRMETRATYRRSRRSRKCRYRSPRFKNRSASRRKGRLPPSIKSRSDTVVKVVRRLAGLLPVSAIVVEVAKFDTQAMRAGKSRLPGWAYQRGEQYGFENVKMYVRARDKYTCQYCGAVMPARLEVDHIIPKSRGGSTTPDNLVSACHDCNHAKGDMTAVEFGYPDIQKRVKKSLAAAAHTQAGKTATKQGLAEIGPIEETYGYVTKVDRDGMGLPKTNYFDAVAIASRGEPVEILPWYESLKAVSRGQRQQRKGKHSHKVARMPYEVFGFRMWDRVRLPDGTNGFVGARRETGSFTIKNASGDIIGKVSYRKLQLLKRATTLPGEIRTVANGAGAGPTGVGNDEQF